MSTDRPPRDDSYIRLKRFGRLLARVAWLTDRIEHTKTGANVSFDESERAALIWAIDELKEKYPELANTKPPTR